MSSSSVNVPSADCDQDSGQNTRSNLVGAVGRQEASRTFDQEHAHRKQAASKQIEINAHHRHFHAPQWHPVQRKPQQIRLESGVDEQEKDRDCIALPRIDNEPKGDHEEAGKPLQETCKARVGRESLSARAADLCVERIRKEFAIICDSPCLI